MHFTVLRDENASIAEFVDSWSYIPDRNQENIYIDNIDLGRKSESIEKLYLWKNGGKISIKKTESYTQYYKYDDIPKERQQLKNDSRSFLKGRGGAIWNIFWAHILIRDQFPIFDQHVYRAMLYIKGKPLEPLHSNKNKIVDIYLDNYLNFFKLFKDEDQRKADLALWNFGRFLALKHCIKKSTAH